MPTYRYYISGFISDRLMHYILNDFIDPVNENFTPGQFPTFRRMERSSTETTFLVDIPDIVGWTENDYDDYMGGFKASLAQSKDQAERADNEEEV